ncbi:MAG: ferrous iron transport protein B, partial [Lentisphaerae bacterium GWF2_52_8]
PNSGKSCLFNNLTGAMQRVGNYPGVTVEFAVALSRFGDEDIELIDLPGAYSLSAYSHDELVARDCLLKEKPDLIINVVDASNLERNLYLTVQLMELRRPMLVALNMVDLAERKGRHVDAAHLGELLGLKVIPTIANKEKGLEDLKNACVDTLAKGLLPKPVYYGHVLEEVLPRFEAALLPAIPPGHEAFSLRWTALRLLEDDPLFKKEAEGWPQRGALTDALNEARSFIVRHCGEDAATAVTEARYAIAAGAARDCIAMSEKTRMDISHKIDTVFCNRLAGPLLLCAVVYGLFAGVFKIAGEWTWLPLFDGTWTSPMGLMERFFSLLAGHIETHVSNLLLRSLLNDGIIGGVGGVLSFVPLIFFMFFFISALEDSGYIARVAFILDRVLRCFGLQGKSILSLIVSGGLGGGGCAVPGILAARTLREEKDRLVTIIVAPMMNCGAKLPVYAMLIGAFFSQARGAAMFFLWALSWFFALVAAWGLRKWVIKGEQTPFVMELPPYHLPTIRGMLLHSWSNTWMYLKKAGTIILGVSLLVWALMYFPVPDQRSLAAERAKIQAQCGGSDDCELMLSKIDAQMAQDHLRHSYAGQIGTWLSKISFLAGFDWKENIALLGGFAAKELIVGTMGTAYAMGNADANETSLSSRLAADPSWSPLRAFAFMVFVMLYAPCLATIAVIKTETNSWRWPFFALAFNTAFAFLAAMLVYQAGCLLGF